MELYKIETLDRLLRFMDDIVIDNSLNIKNLTSIKECAAFGDRSSKGILKEAILKYTRRYLNLDTIDILINQYHINYFLPLYTGKNPDFSRIINSMCIDKDDDIDSKINLLVQIMYQELYGLSVIDSYYYNNIEGLNEISLNTKEFISLQINGQKERIEKLFFKNENTYEKIIKRSVSHEDMDNLDPEHPEVLSDNLCGARLTAIMPPYSRYYSLNVRYTGTSFFSKDILIDSKTSNSYMETFMDLVLNGRPNIFVLGGQGTGKTTYLMRLIGSIPKNVSILTIESTMELDILKYFPDKDVKNLRFSVLRSPEDCFKTALRMGRDIIIDGEVRSPEEAYITLEAMTRQNRGSMGSFHTSSNQDFIYDYKNMLLKGNIYKSEGAALYDIARAVDILIYLSLDRNTGHRYIKQVSELIFKPDDYKKPYELNTLFEYTRKRKELISVNRISKKFIERAFEYEFTEEHERELYELYKKMGI